jgi:hypothetical protein
VAQQLPPATLKPVVRSEVRTQVWRTFDLNPDCTPAGDVTITVTKQPQKGNVEIEENLGFSTYSQQRAPQYYQCNTQPTAGTSVFYTSAAGFKGTDNFELEITSARGASRNAKISVNVK